MKIQIGDKEFSVNADSAIDISIPLRFNGPQPNAYGVERAVSKPVEAGGLVGDTRQGGSVNFEQYTFIPHCNGTHTECVGHITNERISVRDCLKDVFIPAALVSVEPERSADSDELVITSKSLSEPGSIATGFFDAALIVRTLPNDSTKLTREYDEENIPPYFTTDAMQFIVERGFKHLLVDLPSIDRIYDDGKLVNHRLFWNVEPGSFEVSSDTRRNNTITELIYAPNEIPDGEYLLNLQIAPFDTDCSPSRPVILPAKHAKISK
jgi:kynurenine formamidase